MYNYSCPPASQPNLASASGHWSVLFPDDGGEYISVYHTCDNRGTPIMVISALSVNVDKSMYKMPGVCCVSELCFLCTLSSLATRLMCY